MKSQILTFFEGEINGVKFNNEQIYYSTEYILDEIEEQFGEVYNDIFVNNLQYVIERYMNTIDYASYAKLENSMTTDIENTKSFEEIKFSEPYIQQLNDDLSQGLNSSFSIHKTYQDYLFRFKKWECEIRRCYFHIIRLTYISTTCHIIFIRKKIWTKKNPLF